MSLWNERECWLEEDAYDEHFSALCVEGDNGVEVFAPLLIGQPSGTPERQRVGIFYCEPISGLKVAIDYPELSADVDIAQAIAPSVIDGFESSIERVAEVHRQGWVITDLDCMQMARKVDDRTYQMIEIESCGLYHRVASATIDLGDYTLESLEDMASAYYTPCDGRSALDELAYANDVRGVSYGEDGYPNQILAECVFESCMEEHHGYSIETSNGTATFDDAVSLMVDVAISLGNRPLNESRHAGIRH